MFPRFLPYLLENWKIFLLPRAYIFVRICKVPKRLCKYYIKTILWINKKYVMYLPSTYLQKMSVAMVSMGIMNITREVASKIDKHTLFNPLFLCIFYSFPITTQQHCAMDLSRVRISSINLLCIY